MIETLFKLLLFTLPLVFLKNTSELFEFNKIIVLYIFTILITATWAINCIRERKIIFRRTILDLPLVIFLSAMLVSTLFSIDPRTSWLGYYSRFNGGLASLICYALLYWAFVSSVEKKQLNPIFNYWIVGLLIASVLAILEHFDIGVTCGLMGLGWNTNCWVQDVQNRVFSTFGQPNWLASTLVAVLPITWFRILNTKYKIHNTFWILVSAVFFVTLLFTKSRSGLLGFGAASVVFWGFIIWKEKLKYLPHFCILICVFLVIFFVFQPKTYDLSPNTSQGPALEAGGTESGEIRKNVWIGAIEIWKNYPLTGTGVETFAFAYPMHKPIKHNLVSEWDFIYNKAHNEYLNYLATTGGLGFLSYIVLIFFSIHLFIFSIRNSKLFDITRDGYSYWLLVIGVLSGYAGILVTNFFGFSVVPVSLLTFLFPALAVVSRTQNVARSKSKIFDSTQWVLVCVVILTTYYLLHSTVRYWYSDVLYNKGRLLNRSDDSINAVDILNKAIKLNPNEPVILGELSTVNSELALTYSAQNDLQNTEKFVNKAITTSEQAISLAPYNINAKKTYAGVLTKLVQFNKSFMMTAISVIDSAIQIAPTDPKLHYQLGLLYLKTGQNQSGLETLEKAVNLKPNYKEGRFALGLTYRDLGMLDKAKEQLQYILDNIDPKDELTKKYLEELN